MVDTSRNTGVPAGNVCSEILTPSLIQTICVSGRSNVYSPGPVTRTVPRSNHFVGLGSGRTFLGSDRLEEPR